MTNHQASTKGQPIPQPIDGRILYRGRSRGGGTSARVSDRRSAGAILQLGPGEGLGSRQRNANRSRSSSGGSFDRTFAKSLPTAGVSAVRTGGWIARALD